ncbi:MAG: hypothetical protein K2X52_27715 [Mycobacteriaceae bacterium]|nr:hypothetical protein [Mycobacteriaceae bacterium]
MSDTNEFITAADIYDDNARDIETHRGELIAALNEAMGALNCAHHAASALTSNQVYDVELAEGSAGGDLAAFLADSARAARAAYSIVHHIAEHS